MNYTTQNNASLKVAACVAPTPSVSIQQRTHITLTETAKAKLFLFDLYLLATTHFNSYWFH